MGTYNPCSVWLYARPSWVFGIAFRVFLDQSWRFTFHCLAFIASRLIFWMIFHFRVLSLRMFLQRSHIRIPSTAGRFPHSVQIPASMRCCLTSRFRWIRCSRFRSWNAFIFASHALHLTCPGSAHTLPHDVHIPRSLYQSYRSLHTLYFNLISRPTERHDLFHSASLVYASFMARQTSP